jgi:hypothetical protein
LISGNVGQVIGLALKLFDLGTRQIGCNQSTRKTAAWDKHWSIAASQNFATPVVVTATSGFAMVLQESVRPSRQSITLDGEILKTWSVGAS